MSSRYNPHAYPPGPPPGPPPMGPPMGPPPPPPPNRLGKVLLGTMGTLISLISVPCLAATINDVIVGTQNTSGAIIIGVMAAMLAVIGGSMIYGAFRQPKQANVKEDRNWEKTILELARRHQGFLSAAQVAVETNLSIEESQKMLDSMVEKSAAQIDIDGNGYTVYRFPTFVKHVGPAAQPPVNQNQRDLAEFDKMLSESNGSNVSFDFEQKQQQQQQQHLNAAPHHFQNKK